MMSDLTRMPDVLGESIYHSGSSFVQCRDIRFYSRDHSLSSQEPRQGDITCPVCISLLVQLTLISN